MTRENACTGGGKTAGESWPGLSPLRTCPDCRGMFPATRHQRMPRHAPATAADLEALERSKARLMYIVFRQGPNWSVVAPVVHLDVEDARTDADARRAQVIGIPRRDARRYARLA